MLLQSGVADMILSGATGVLQKIDATNRLLTLSRRSGTQDYECAVSSETSRWMNLVGKMVTVQLCDFLVLDVSENPDKTLPSAQEEK